MSDRLKKLLKPGLTGEEQHGETTAFRRAETIGNRYLDDRAGYFWSFPLLCGHGKLTERFCFRQQYFCYPTAITQCGCPVWRSRTGNYHRLRFAKGKIYAFWTDTKKRFPGNHRDDSVFYSFHLLYFFIRPV